MKIGIIGGSFDPIHNGHLMLAEQARVEAGLARVIFMPAYLSPFKQNASVTEAEKRLAMVRLAVEGNPFFEVSDMEIRAGEVSYTAQTMRSLIKEMPEQTELCFITGADAFLGIEDWNEAEYLLQNISFLAALRPGFREDELDRLIQRLGENYGTDITKIRCPQVDISSTGIREMLSFGYSPRYLLPDRVLDYIDRQGLYAPELSDPICTAHIRMRITQYIRENLKPGRYAHTMGVAQEAKTLAERFGADPAKAELCALFHDACRSAGNLEHGGAAAELMEADYRIKDQDMLDAVRFHTTGREGMSLLERVLYVADAVEPQRDYPGVAELRRAAQKDLDLACLLSMEHTMNYLRSQGKQIEEHTVRAWNEIKKRRENG